MILSVCPDVEPGNNIFDQLSVVWRSNSYASNGHKSMSLTLYVASMAYLDYLVVYGLPV
jgi:hypothetical protein